MRKIEMEQIQACHNVAREVFQEKISIEAGAKGLHSEHGLNINSARDFINDYRLMQRGEVFQRAMSAPAMNYFLQRIVDDDGVGALRLAVAALRKHIEYYEGLRPARLRSLRDVMDKYEDHLRTPVSLDLVLHEFDQSVQRSLADSSIARQQRLRGAPKFAQKITALVEVFVRNVDVVAEVLGRASGLCEQCGRGAPFARKSNGTPYLEVHHVRRLADGGEDTVDNAVALCPNCHRQQHYGIGIGNS